MIPALTFAGVTLATVALAALRRPAPGVRRLESAAPSGTLIAAGGRHDGGKPCRPPAQRAALHPARTCAQNRWGRPEDPWASASAVDAPAWVREALVEFDLGLDPAATWVAARWAAALAVALSAVGAGAAFAAITGGALVAGPSILRRVLARRGSDRREAQLPQALERLASNVRAGGALGPAFVAMARATAEPLGSELRATAAEVEHGSGLAAALGRWSARPESGSQARLAAAALGLAAEAGGEVARSIDRVAATLRERRELQAEVRALATQARASAAVLAVAPLAFTALVAGVEPTAITFLLTSPTGLACLAGGLTLEAAGATWMARILRSVA